MNRNMVRDTQKSIEEIEKKVVSSLEKKINEGYVDSKKASKDNVEELDKKITEGNSAHEKRTNEGAFRIEKAIFHL